MRELKDENPGCLWAEKAESWAALGWLPVLREVNRVRGSLLCGYVSVSPQQCKNV